MTVNVVRPVKEAKIAESERTTDQEAKTVGVEKKAVRTASSYKVAQSSE